MQRQKLIFTAFLLLTLACGLYTITFAEVPHLINYQGRLTDKSSKPLDGTYNLTFKIYDAETAGNLLWEETHQAAAIQKGIFSVLLGSVTNLNLTFDKPYYLEIKVNNEVMSPRQAITSAGYAIRAERAEETEKVGGKDLSNLVQVTNDQLIGGIKTFLSLPVLPAFDPKQDNQAARKAYVDSKKVSLGTWENRDRNVVYQAVTDGFLVGYVAAMWGPIQTFWQVNIKTDSNNPPSIVRWFAKLNDTRTDYGFCVPVKKNDYYKIEDDAGSGSWVIYWISLNN